MVLLYRYHLKTCAVQPAQLHLGVFSGFAKEACPWGLRSACILTECCYSSLPLPPFTALEYLYSPFVLQPKYLVRSKIGNPFGFFKSWFILWPPDIESRNTALYIPLTSCLLRISPQKILALPRETLNGRVLVLNIYNPNTVCMNIKWVPQTEAFSFWKAITIYN